MNVPRGTPSPAACPQAQSSTRPDSISMSAKTLAAIVFATFGACLISSLHRISHEVNAVERIWL